MGIEPTSSAWEAEVMAIIRRPQNAQFYMGLPRCAKRAVSGGRALTWLGYERRPYRLTGNVWPDLRPCASTCLEATHRAAMQSSVVTACI